MLGRGSYGPAGKWVHDRAHGIMEDGRTPKDVAYAVATQQAHKLGKSPKDFRTPKGVHEAKMKYDEPKSQYQKTAADGREEIVPYEHGTGGWVYPGMTREEVQQMPEEAYRRTRGPIVAGSTLAGGVGGGFIGSSFGRGGTLLGTLGGLGLGYGAGRFLGHRSGMRARQVAEQEAVPYLSEKSAMLAGFFDEFDKIAQTGEAFHSAVRAGGGHMTDAAYAAGRGEWLKQQAAKKNLGTIVKKYGRTGGSAALPAAGGILSKLRGLVH